MKINYLGIWYIYSNMSFNRTIYDDCAYSTELNEQRNMLHYNLNPNKFYNQDQKRINFGLLGGNNVSQSPENLIDLESDLRNQTRLYSRCPIRKFNPTCDINKCGSKTGLPCEGCPSKMLHMPEGTMIDYKPRFNNVGYDLRNIGCPVKNPTMWSYAPKPAPKAGGNGGWFKLPLMKTK